MTPQMPLNSRSKCDPLRGLSWRKLRHFCSGNLISLLLSRS
jgi:hypothetical protein